MCIPWRCTVLFVSCATRSIGYNLKSLRNQVRRTHKTKGYLSARHRSHWVREMPWRWPDTFVSRKNNQTAPVSIGSTNGRYWFQASKSTHFNFPSTSTTSWIESAKNDTRTLMTTNKSVLWPPARDDTFANTFAFQHQNQNGDPRQPMNTWHAHFSQFTAFNLPPHTRASVSALDSREWSRVGVAHLPAVQQCKQNAQSNTDRMEWIFMNHFFCVAYLGE